MGASFYQNFTSNTSSNGVRLRKQDRTVVLDLRGTLGAGNVTLESSPDNETTWVANGAAVSAASQVTRSNVSGTHIRVTYAGGTGQDADVRVFWDDE